MHIKYSLIQINLSWFSMNCWGFIVLSKYKRWKLFVYHTAVSTWRAGIYTALKPCLSLSSTQDRQCFLASWQRSSVVWGLARWLSGKESTCQCKRCKRHRFDLWVGKIPWSRKWKPTAVLHEKFHGQRSLVDYIVHGIAESSRTRLIDWAQNRNSSKKRTVFLVT